MPSRAVGLARLAHEDVIGRQRRAHRAAGIAGRRLDPDVLEMAVAQNLAVGDAIERHAAGQAQVSRPGLLARGCASSAARLPPVTAWIEAARSMWNGVSN